MIQIKSIKLITLFFLNPKYSILLNNLNEQLNFIDLEIDDQIQKCEQAITVILKSNELKK